jgi:hypothetical protein
VSGVFSAISKISFLLIPVHTCCFFPGAEEFLVLELPHLNVHISWPLKRMEEILDVESLQY